LNNFKLNYYKKKKKLLQLPDNCDHNIALILTHSQFYFVTKITQVMVGNSNASTFIPAESGAIYIAGRGKSMHRQESSVLGLDVLDPFIASPKKLAFNFPNKVSVDHVPPNNDRSLYSRSVPAQIKQIQLGNYHVMALTNQGEVFTWGWGEQGQLGHGDDLNQPLPKLVETLREVLYIGAGTQFSMALTYYGELYAWGHNDMGQLGIGNTTMQKSPVRVKKVQNVLHFACGTSHAVAVTWEGEGMQSVVWQWGQQNTHGKVQTLPLEVSELAHKGIHRVACGEWHSLALSLSGEVYTWTLGQTATRVKDLSGVCVKQVACGSHHSLALDDHGVVWSWGSRNHSGQLGRLTAPSSSSAQSTASPGTMRSAPPTGGVDPNAADLISDLLTVPGPNAETKPALNSSSENKPVPLLPISSVSCGAYHSVALTESDAFKLAQYRLLRIERSYALKMQVLVEQYMPALLQLDWASFDALPPHARSRRSVPSPLSPRRELLVEDGASLCRSMFGNITLVRELCQRVLKDLHSVIEGWDNVGSVGQIFVNHLKSFSIYLAYADNYNTAATNLHVLINSSDLFAQAVKVGFIALVSFTL
jgi:alpha-tubulin suppressor-like RCC1 family protein